MEKIIKVQFRRCWVQVELYLGFCMAWELSKIISMWFCKRSCSTIKVVVMHSTVVWQPPLKQEKKGKTRKKRWTKEQDSNPKVKSHQFGKPRLYFLSVRFLCSPFRVYCKRLEWSCNLGNERKRGMPTVATRGPRSRGHN